MSTKAIREALDYLENYLGSNDEAQAARRAARKELEAIEKATAERNGLAEEILEGDTGALDRLVQMAVDDADAAIARQGEET